MDTLALMGTDSAKLLRAAVQQLPDAAVLVFDPQMKIELCTERLVPDTGGRLPAELEAAAKAALAGETSTLRLGERTVEVSPVRDGVGRVIGGIVAERAGEDLFERVFTEAPIGMGLIAADGTWMRVNRTLCEMSGLAVDQLERASFADILHPDEREDAAGTVARMIGGEVHTWQGEHRLVDSGGTELVVSLSLAVVDAVLVAQIEDITARKRVETRLHDLAERDPLTGLWNRRHFEGELGKQLARCRRYGEPAALAIIDLDNFKYLNDTLGHKAGDDMIKLVARALTTRLRSTDVIARLGGDEFAVLLAHVEESEARSVADDIAAVIRAEPLQLGDINVHTTASVGVAIVGASDDPQEALTQADGAMYDAKGAGGDRACMFQAGGASTATARGLEWSETVSTALKGERLALHAQPVVELSTGEAVGYELLVRMLDPHGELVPPAAFLYAAERLGLLEAVDRWVVTQAAVLLGQRAQLALSVNISGRTLGSVDFPRFVAARLAENGADPRRLTIECAESELIANLGQAAAMSREFIDLGCRFAIDDFRAGLGGFSYLNHLCFDELKIDGELTNETGQVDRLTVAAIAQLGAGLDVRVVAKHVADPERRQSLIEAGVGHGQGFTLGAPAPLVSQLTGA
jgi:diguanylate cyclase (GGDEF)-like protein/PAS domain S-box-containing protein